MRSDEFLRLFRLTKPCFIKLYVPLAWLDSQFDNWKGDNLIRMAEEANGMWENDDFLTIFDEVCNTNELPTHIENQRRNRGTSRIPMWQLLLSLLAFFGHGTTDVVTHLNFRLTTFYDRITNLMKIINIVFKQSVTFPFTNNHKMQELALDSSRSYLKGCVGCIDGMHIPLEVSF